MSGDQRKQGGARSRLEEARAQMYRDLVLECAEQLFAGGRFEQVTMRDIAAEAGISPKTLYVVFPSKEDVYAEVARRRSLALLERLRESVSGGGSALERMQRSVRALVGFLAEHRAFFRILMRESRSWGLLPGGGDSGDWRVGHRLQARLMQDGIDEGVFYDGDPELMAAICIAVAQVQLAALLERPDGPDVDEISREIYLQLQRTLGRVPATAVDLSAAG